MDLSTEQAPLEGLPFDGQLFQLVITGEAEVIRPDTNTQED